MGMKQASRPPLSLSSSVLCGEFLPTFFPVGYLWSGHYVEASKIVGKKEGEEEFVVGGLAGWQP